MMILYQQAIPRSPVYLLGKIYPGSTSVPSGGPLSVLTVTKLRVHCLQLRIAMELIVPFTDPKEFVKETDRELLSSRIVHCFKQGGRSGWDYP